LKGASVWNEEARDEWFSIMMEEESPERYYVVVYHNGRKEHGVRKTNVCHWNEQPHSQYMLHSLMKRRQPSQ
jgi:hypothetical protein